VSQEIEHLKLLSIYGHVAERMAAIVSLFPMIHPVLVRDSVRCLFHKETAQHGTTG
jgi:hypothetical protein